MHSYLSKPPLGLTLTDLETLRPKKPNLSQHIGTCHHVYEY